MIRFLFLWCLLVCSCAHDPEFRDVTVNNSVFIRVSDNLVPARNSNPNAILHFEDTIHSVYLLVIAESKDSMNTYEMDFNLSSYFDQTSKDLSARLSSGTIKNINAEKISGADAFISDIEGKTGKQNVHYKFAAIETGKHFYQVIAAFPSEDSLYSESLMTSIRSFKELESK